MAVGLMFFVLFTGSTVFLLRATIETFGLYIANIVPMAFWNDTLAQYQQQNGGWGWQGNWTVFYWAWTVTWSPFIGIFVARISRGRTIREFVLGVLFAPSIFTLVWFAIFGWSAMEIDGIGADARAALGEQAGVLSTAVEDSIPLAMFAFFEHFPFATIIKGLAVLIVAIFLPPPRTRRRWWLTCCAPVRRIRARYASACSGGFPRGCSPPCSSSWPGRPACWRCSR